MEQQHTIGKLSLQVKLPSSDDAFTLQGQLSHTCMTELTQRLAELLDTWTNENDLIKVDKLEIDLGTCAAEELRKQLPELVIAQLKERYHNIRHDTYLEDGIERVPLSQGYFDSWLYFLEHGVLPPFAVKWTRMQWEEGVLATLASETTALQKCQELFTDKPVAVKRLQLQFSRHFIQQFIAAYGAGTYQEAYALLTEWETFSSHPVINDVIKTGGLQEVLKSSAGIDTVVQWLIGEVIIPRKQVDTAFLLGKMIQLSKPDALKYWLYVLQESPQEVLNMLPVVKTAGLTLASQYNESLVGLRQELAVKSTNNGGYQDNKSQKAAEENSIDSINNKSSDNESSDKKSSDHKSADSDLSDNILSDNKSKDNKPEEDGSADSKSVNDTSSSDKKEYADELNNDDIMTEQPAEGTMLYIGNAGLVLLHPYLAILFQELQLTDFKDIDTISKAVQVLGYLASGRDDLHEYELVFPKILCGLHPGQPVKYLDPLKEEEKTAANELLEAVIAHWNALGSTTPDGLRGNFLMREGKLEWKDEEWQLYVTQQPYDMLLNRLPWGFSVVSLSWMPWLIKTVWT